MAESAGVGAAVRLGNALWSGLAAFARPELANMATDGSLQPDVRAAAAHELAAWHLDRGELDDADRWYGQLDTDLIEHAVVVACIDNRLGRLEAATARLDDWVQRRPADPHLRLHLANQFTGTPDADQRRNQLFNGVLVAGGVAPIAAWRIETGALVLDVDPAVLVATEDGPLVTVIMPAFDAATTIANSLASVQAQTHRRLQIIVVDDASSDGTADVVRQLAAADDRIVLVRAERNGGAYAARNLALRRADGAFVTVHDADDWMHPQRIARQVEHLEQHAEVPGNATHWVRVDRNLGFHPHGRHPYKVVGKSTASLMVRRELFGVIGPWDEVARGAADFELLKRLEARFGPVQHLSRHLPLAVSLRAPGSLTGSSATGIGSLWHVNGVRRQYLDGFTAWHRERSFPAGLPFDPWSSARRFQVPSLLSGAPAHSEIGVVVAADLSAASPMVTAALARLSGVGAGDRSVALLHEPNSLEALDHPLDPAVIDVLTDGRTRLLSSGETVRCRELIRLGSGVIGGRLDGRPDVVVDPMVG